MAKISMSIGQAITSDIPLLEPGHPAFIPILARQLAEIPVLIDSTVDPDVKAKKKQRPCRGQRMRSINFVAMLKKEISENPEGFEFDKIELLPSISTNEKRRMKLRQNIEEFRLQAMINKLQKSGIGSCTETPNTERSVIDKSQPQAFEEHTCR